MGHPNSVAFLLSLLVFSATASNPRLEYVQRLRRQQESEALTFPHLSVFGDNFRIDGRRPEYVLPDNGIIDGEEGRPQHITAGNVSLCWCEPI